MNSWKCARRLCSTGLVLKEQVHQHGLAAADLAVDVEPARRRLVLVGKQPAEQTLLAPRLVARQPLFKRRKGLRGLAPARDRPRSRRRQRAPGSGRGRKWARWTAWPTLPPEREGNCKRANCGWGYANGLVMPAKAGIRYAPARPLYLRRLWEAGSFAFADDDSGRCEPLRLTRSARRNPRPHRDRRRSRRARRTARSATPGTYGSGNSRAPTDNRQRPGSTRRAAAPASRAA